MPAQFTVPPAPINNPLALVNGKITDPAWLAWLTQVLFPVLTAVVDAGSGAELPLQLRGIPDATGDGSALNMPVGVPMLPEDAEFPPAVPAAPDEALFPPTIAAPREQPELALFAAALAGQVQIPWVVVDTLANQPNYPNAAYPVGAIFVASDKQLFYENDGVTWIQTPDVPASAELLKSNSDKQIIAAALANGKVWIGSGANLPAQQSISGDATLANTGALTLTNSGVGAGTYGDALNVPQFTVDAKGRITAAANVPINLGGYSGTVPLAKLTALGTNGSITFVDGIATAAVDPT